MTKRTLILLNEKSGWIAGGQDGSSPELQEWAALADSAQDTIQTLAQAVVDKIAELRLPRKQIILILGPSYLEYRPFQVPPVDNRELPQIVQMLARTQFTQTTDESVVDFVSMPASSTQGASQAFVGATTQRTNLLLDELRERGLQIQRILPRTTTLGLLHNDPSDRQFWINVQANEMDVFVAGLEQLLLVRSSILPTGPARDKTIRREVTRTLAVLAAEYGTSIHKRIEVAGSEADRAVVIESFNEEAPNCHALLAGSIGQLSVDVPVQDLGTATTAMAALAEKHAALLDFANPTQPPKDSVIMRNVLIAGACVAAVVLMLLGFAWINLQRLDSQIAEVQAKVDRLEDEEVNNQAIIDNVGRINQFLMGDVDALAVLERLSQDMPYGDQFRVQKIAVKPQANGERHAVDLVSQISDTGVSYREILNKLEDWEANKAPTIDPKLAAESDFYQKTVQEIISYTPRFDRRYEPLAEVVYAAMDAENLQSMTEENVKQDVAASSDSSEVDESRDAKEAEEDEADEDDTEKDEDEDEGEERISTNLTGASAPSIQ